MKQTTKIDYAFNDFLKIYADCECEECKKAFKYTSLNFALQFSVDKFKEKALAIFPMGRQGKNVAYIELGKPNKDFFKQVKSVIRKLQRKKVCISEWYRYIDDEFDKQEGL